MTWVKLDDQFGDHPKVAAAGPLAGWLHVRALCYCSRHLTDGFVPRDILRTLWDWGFEGVSQVASGSSEGLAEKLTSVGMWMKVDGGFQIHDYLEYNPSAADVRAKREAERKKKESARARKKELKLTKLSPHVSPGDISIVPPCVPALSPPCPSLPDPDPHLRLTPPLPTVGDPLRPLEVVACAPKKPKVAKSVATRIDPAWQPSKKTLDSLADLGVDLGQCVPEFVDFWLSARDGAKCDWDATFRNRVRQLVAAGKAPMVGRESGVMPVSRFARYEKPWIQSPGKPEDPNRKKPNACDPYYKREDVMYDFGPLDDEEEPRAKVGSP